MSRFKITLISISLVKGLISQNDLAQELQAQKWYSDGSPRYTSIYYSKNPLPNQAGTMVFLKNGKVIRCDSVESGEGANVAGKGRFVCDSLSVYTLKKNKMHLIEDGSRHWYYKIIKKTSGFEFSPIYSEDFNKD
jgi:hypothetical protein